MTALEILHDARTKVLMERWVDGSAHLQAFYILSDAIARVGAHSDEQEPHYSTCGACGGSGMIHWYLGDEFNSQGYSECDRCDGTAMEES